jgi:hypothetical protein
MSKTNATGDDSSPSPSTSMTPKPTNTTNPIPQFQTEKKSAEAPERRSSKVDNG